MLVLRLESVQKWPKKQWTQYKHAEAHMEIFALEGDLSSEIGLMKTDNVTVTDFFDDYVHVHNTQTRLISRRIMKEASLYIIQ